MGAVRAGNLALRFVLELCMLGALSFWGFATGTNPVTWIGLGLGVPVLAAVLWGTFLSPKAAVSVPVRARVLLELLLFGAAVAGLAHAGERALALGFGVLVLVNEALVTALGQRGTRRRPDG